MRYFNDNFYFCHTPIVDPEEHYDCEHMISIQQLPEDYPREKLAKLLQQGTSEWNNCVETLEIPKEYAIINQTRIPRYEYSSTLKQEVIDWLNENVKDSTDKLRKDMPQGWMIYDPMRVHQTTEVSVFFLRGSDAVAFKLRWT